uniref:Retroviral polymerase SH3-like domain-containing protein n=1 Tax=Strigamia maritima TaxID=126957 RepID=T1IKA4_STRMM
SRCFRLLPKIQRDSKLGEVSTECILVGYSWNTRGYRVYDPSDDKIYNTQDVRFVETPRKNDKGNVIEFDTNNEDNRGNLTPTPTPTPIPKPEQTRTKLITPKLNNHELSKRFRNFAFKRVAEPFKVGFDLAELNLEGDILDLRNYPYRTLVGILLFVSRYTRPDICIAIGILARYNAKPTLVHWKCLLHLWYYVLSTKEKTIHLSKDFDLGINCFVDASWATSPDDRKSITGNNPVIWHTAKQNLLTMRPMESELIALSELTKEVIWFKRFFCNCDNCAAIHYISNDVENSKTKYIDVKLQFMKQNYQAGLFESRYVYTKKNLADILTKRVNR